MAIQTPPAGKPRLLDGLSALGSAITALALAIITLRPWRGPLSIPYEYMGDALPLSMLVKATLTQGWYGRNPRLGAPFSQHFVDFPMPDNLHFLIFKFLGLFTSDYGAVINTYYLATFALIAATMHWLLRRMNISRKVAFVISVLYAIAPYHFFRGEQHLFLSAYYVVPLAGFILWSAITGAELFERSNGRSFLPSLLTRKNIAMVFICVILGSASSYYALFTVFLLMPIVFVRWILSRKYVPLLSGCIVAGLIVAMVGINMLPNILYRAEHGPNELLANRPPADSELYALKLSQLVLPMHGHRVDEFSELRYRYVTTFPSQGEEPPVALGSIALLGLLGLAFVALAKLAGDKLADKIDSRYVLLSALVCLSFLIATVGGLSAFVSLLITPQIRAWSRLSIFISMFCFMAVAICLDSIRTKIEQRNWHPMLFSTGLLVIMAVGYLDQTAGRFIYPLASNKAEFDSDRSFVKAIERKLPDEAMVYQFPFNPFPESPPVVRMLDYDQLRGYLHSDSLRWSAGGIKGRPESAWQEKLSGLPVEEVLRRLVAAGFDGAYVDRFAYPDNGMAIEGELAKISGSTPVISRNQRLSFFDLTNYDRKLRSDLPRAQLTQLKKETLAPAPPSA